MKTIGELIDEVYSLRSTRLLLEKEVTLLKQEEARLSKFIGDELIETGCSAMRGSIANFSYKKSTVPGVEDWNQVYNFVEQDHAFSLLGRAISIPTWRDYKESGVLIPGTYEIEKIKYSITKAGVK
jgi:hypothetical protein